jgi:Eukaryotic aspartyl protease
MGTRVHGARTVLAWVTDTLMGPRVTYAALGGCFVMALAAACGGGIAGSDADSPKEAGADAVVDAGPVVDATAVPPDAGAADGDAGTDAADAGDGGFARDGTAGPDAMTREAGPVVAVNLGGCYSNLYTAPVTLGTTQQFQLALDTGSTTLTVAGQDCPTCVDAGLTPLYAPGASAMDLGFPVQSNYDGPGCCQSVNPDYGFTGEAYADTVTVGGLSTQVDLGAMQAIGGGFLTVGSPNANASCDTPTGSVPSHIEGIVGLGPDGLLVSGTTSFWDGIVSSGEELDVFAVKLCHVGGTLWLGGFDPTALTGPLQYTGMNADYGYSVDWTGVAVSGADLDGGAQVPFADPAAQYSIIDSGGNGFFVPTTQFDAIAAAIEGSPAFGAAFGPSWLSTTAQQYTNCVTLPKLPAKIDAEMPSLTLQLGSTNPIAVPLTATQSYLTYTYLPSNQVSYCQNRLRRRARSGGHLLPRPHAHAGSRHGLRQGESADGGCAVVVPVLNGGGRRVLASRRKKALRWAPGDTRSRQEGRPSARAPHMCRDRRHSRTIAESPPSALRAAHGELLRRFDEQTKRCGAPRLAGEVEEEAGDRRGVRLEHAPQASGAQRLHRHRLERVREPGAALRQRDREPAVAAHDAPTNGDAPRAAAALELPGIERPCRPRAEGDALVPE